jgi:hypothetical protein
MKTVKSNVRRSLMSTEEECSECDQAGLASAVAEYSILAGVQPYVIVDLTLKENAGNPRTA